MTTGFIGTVLSENGRHDLAVQLFQSRKFPSWGYEVLNGATSVWERWDSFTPEHGFNGRNGDQNAAMNSFNHYAFGAVMEWAFRFLAGIDTIGEGYKNISIKPLPLSRSDLLSAITLKWVEVKYKSVNGTISCRWESQKDKFELNCEIPPNTTALVHLPANRDYEITESGNSLETVSELTILARTETILTLNVPSGRYSFCAKKVL